MFSKFSFREHARILLALLPPQHHLHHCLKCLLNNQFLQEAFFNYLFPNRSDSPFIFLNYFFISIAPLSFILTPTTACNYASWVIQAHELRKGFCMHVKCEFSEVEAIGINEMGKGKHAKRRMTHPN